MAAKTTGAEIKQFYNDSSWWTTGVWHEEEYILVNGTQEDSDNIFNFKDTDVVSISGGVVRDNDYNEIASFEGFFRKWKKQQNTSIVVLEVPKDKMDELTDYTKTLGIKIKA